MKNVVHLTRREAEVLGLIACGCTYATAAYRLGVSLHTISTHIKSSYYKLEVHSAGAAVMRAVELGIIGSGTTVAATPIDSVIPSSAEVHRNSQKSK